MYSPICIKQAPKEINWKMLAWAGLSLEGDLGEKVSLNWFTSPYYELREKF